MSETIVIKDRKKRKWRWIILLLILIIPVIIGSIAKLTHNNELALITVLILVSYMFGVFPSGLYLLYITRFKDKIKIHDGYMYCKSEGVESKYISFWGNAKIPMSKIQSICLDRSTDSIYIYASSLIACIPSLGRFSSKKYMEDVQNFFTQRGIYVENTEEVDDEHTNTQSSKNTQEQRKKTTKSSNISSLGRRRNIVNDNTSIEQKNNQNRHKGRRLEL